MNEAAAQRAFDQALQTHRPAPELLADLQRVGAVMVDEWLTRAGADGQKLIATFRGKSNGQSDEQIRKQSSK